jgi:hypothetical protein
MLLYTVINIVGRYTEVAAKENKFFILGNKMNILCFDV